ncbi:MAG: hypothetical protein BJ554DRAFT_625, partial [Olpidium bornovanus]
MEASKLTTESSEVFRAFLWAGESTKQPLTSIGSLIVAGAERAPRGEGAEEAGPERAAAGVSQLPARTGRGG